MDSYIHLNSGFSAHPTSGSFNAICIDGCGPINPNGVIVNLGVFIEGYMSGINSMQPVLSNQGLDVNTNLTDIVRVNLHDAGAPYSTVASSDVLLNSDGTASVNFPPLNGTYYLEVLHRNSISTWSSTPINIAPGLLIPCEWRYDASSTYGSNTKQLSPGIYALYSGELNADGNIDPLDLALQELDLNNFTYGYFATDINGDGSIDLLDVPIMEDNVNNFIFANHP